MKNIHQINEIGNDSSFSLAAEALRYLKGNHQIVIQQDDPDYFMSRHSPKPKPRLIRRKA